MVLGHLLSRLWGGGLTVAGSSLIPSSQSIAQCIELLFEAPFSHFYFCRSHASLFMVLPPTSDQPSPPSLPQGADFVVLLPHPTGSRAPLLVPPSFAYYFLLHLWFSIRSRTERQCAVQSETLNGTWSSCTAVLRCRMELWIGFYNHVGRDQLGQHPEGDTGPEGCPRHTASWRGGGLYTSDLATCDCSIKLRGLLVPS